MICRRCNLQESELPCGRCWSCARIDAKLAKDFGPEIVPGCRVQNATAGLRGWAYKFRDLGGAAHWRQTESDWRPRDLIVIPDWLNRLPTDHEHLEYWNPDHTMRIPEWWPTKGAGVPKERMVPFQGTVVRYDPLAGLWLMNRLERGWAEKGYRYDTWGELLSQWALVPTECGRDVHSDFIRVEVFFSKGGANEPA